MAKINLCFILAVPLIFLLFSFLFFEKSLARTNPGMKMIYYSIAISISIWFQIDGPRDLVCIFKMTRTKLQEAKSAHSMTLPLSNCCPLLLEISTRIPWLSLCFLSGVKDDGQIVGQGRSGNRPAWPFLLSLLPHFCQGTWNLLGRPVRALFALLFCPDI